MRQPILVRRQVLALTAFSLGARIRTLAAAPSPVGKITWAVHVSRSSLVRPSRNVGSHHILYVAVRAARRGAEADA